MRGRTFAHLRRSPKLQRYLRNKEDARTAQNVSTVRYLPESVVTNAELTERFTALGRPTVIDGLAGERRYHAALLRPGHLGDVGPCRAGSKRGPQSGGTQTGKRRSDHCGYGLHALGFSVL